MFKYEERNGETVLVNRDGYTGEEWGKHQFDYEYCSNCGGDWDDHDYIPFLGGWFARCKAPECIGDTPNRAEGHFCTTCKWFERCLVLMEGEIDLVDYHETKPDGQK